MTPDQIELVAQAFYAAENSGDWTKAPDLLQEHYRYLARAAIAALQQHVVHHQSSIVLEKASKAAPEKEVIQLLY